MRVGGGSGPAVLQVEDEVGIRPLHDVHLDVDWFPQHFGDRVVCWSVEGGVRGVFCDQKRGHFSAFIARELVLLEDLGDALTL